MKKLRVPVFVAAVLAGVLALAGCGGGDDPVIVNVAGAAITSPWALEVNSASITPNGFTVSTGATITGDNPGEQQIEYAVNTAIEPPVANPAAWQTGLTFNNLQPDTDYYVFARTREKTVGNKKYENGTPVRAGAGTDNDTVKTRPDETNASVNPWTPFLEIGEDYPLLSTSSVAGVYNEGVTTFTVYRTTPRVTTTPPATVEYALNADSTTAPAAASDWQTSRNFNFNRVLASQMYLWARTQAAGTTPAGTPLYRALQLPGAAITFPSGFLPSGSASGGVASVSITGEPLKNPNSPAIFAALVVEYALGTRDAPTSTWYRPSAGVINNIPVAANNEYHLWARTAQTTNFRAGDAFRYPNPGSDTGFLFKTGVPVTDASGLRTKLNAITPNAAELSGNNVVLTGKVTVNDTLEIPSGVTLFIDTGGELNAGTSTVTGPGSISVRGTNTNSGGMLIVSYGNVSVADILINPFGSFKVTSLGSAAGTEIVGQNNAVMTLVNSTLHVKASGNRFEYALDFNSGGPPDATINGNQSLTLFEGDKFTILPGAKLTATGSIVGGGTVVVEPGGNFTTSSLATANGFGARGSMTIKSGAILQTDHFTIAQKDVTTVTTQHINLSSGEIVLTKEGTASHFSLNGNADLVKSMDIPTNVVFLVNGSPRTLTVPYIPAATPSIITLTVTGGTLTVNGTLDLEAGTTTVTGGALAVTNQTGSKLEVGGTINVKNYADLHIQGGTTTIFGSSGIIEINSTKPKISGGTVTLNSNSAINVKSGGKLETTGSATIRGNGTMTIERGGQLKTSGELSEYKQGTFPVASFTGGAHIYGELWVGGSSNPYIGYAVSSGTPTAMVDGFRLSSTAASHIILNGGAGSNSIIPIYTLAGTSGAASLVTDTSLKPQGSRFVIGSGTSFTIPPGINFTLASGGMLHVIGTLSASGTTGNAWVSGDAHSVRKSGNAANQNAVPQRIGFFLGNQNYSDSTNNGTMSLANWNDTNIIPLISAP